MQMVIPNMSSKLAQFKQNLSYELFSSISLLRGLNSMQQTDGPWCIAHNATLSMHLRSSKLTQSLQLSFIKQHRRIKFVIKLIMYLDRMISIPTILVDKRLNLKSRINKKLLSLESKVKKT